ncbi:DUF1186 domain-containing protein [Roseococcus sp. SYP-B2431]|uniref:DUF1186 domain-containing protein n=1 Tax=Roseococcus sp. SYP-B2431 TaxID=2496640 RepID=UPI0013F41CFE|nr:DUF1186 domain-containing protein [Roseococcus sp. SYP-B2431]
MSGKKRISRSDLRLDGISIEEQLRAVATELRLPAVAIGLCTIGIEESGPVLLTVLERAADGAMLSEDDERLLFRGVHILGDARYIPACGGLLRLMRRPGDELERLFGDALAQDMARIVAGVFDGDAEALLEIIADPSADEFARNALMGAATFLTWEGGIARDRMREFLLRFHDERMAPDGHMTWGGWTMAIGLLGLRDLAPLVHEAWHRLPWRLMERKHFEADLAAAERRPHDIERFTCDGLGLIEDTVEALQWTDTEPMEAKPWTLPPPLSNAPSAPAANPLRYVGRNDPCPCGSGRKAKKCCLAR